MLPRLIALAALWALALPSPARAWTRAEVREVGAQLDVDADGQALVVLDVGLKVLGGWISELELTGLGPDLALDPDKPPTLWERDGERKFAPEVHVEADGVKLRFPRRRQAPWRGHYVLRLAYRTRLSAAPDSEGPAVAWTLPPWPESLEDVVVRVWAPAGTRALGTGSVDGRRLQVESGARGPLTLLTLRRAHLPRTTPWRISLAMPGAAATAAPGAEAGHARAAPPAEPVGAASPWPLCLCLGLLCLLKLTALRARARREWLSLQHLLPLPRERLRAPLVALVAGAAALVPDHGATLALLALAVGLALPRELRWRASGEAAAAERGLPDLRAASRRARLVELLGPAAWLDASTPAGALLLCATAALMASAELYGLSSGHLPDALLLGAPLLFTGTRRHGPPTHARALALLCRAARSLEAAGVRARPVQLGGPGCAAGAALRIEDDAPAGLHGLWLVVATRRWLGHDRAELALLAEAEAGSDAAVALARRFGPAQAVDAESARWLCGTDDPVAACADAWRAPDAMAEGLRSAA